jgi:MFS family permease
VVVLLVQDKPEDLGLKPDGASRRVPSGSVPSQSDATGAPESAADSADAGLTIRQAIRTPAFWITALSLATFSMLATGLFFHQVSIFASLGLSPQVAARVFPVSAITMVLAMPVVGRMLDRLPTRPTFAAAMLSMSAGTVSLLAVRDVRTALLYAVVFGISNAAINAHLSYLWPRFFGRRHLGSIQGLAQTIAVIGASIGPIPLAFAFDQFGDYRGALITLSLLPVLCAIATLFMRPPRLDDDAACKAA